MNNVLRYAMAGCLAVAGMYAARSDASVVIGGTRVVYPAQDKEVTVKLTNEGKQPALVQVWLDDGDEKSTPDSAKVPFTVTPPLFRIDGGKAQSIRLMHTKEPLAADKETLFWMNVLEVPPKADNNDGSNHLQFAFRTRIKVFFRPSGLSGDVASASDKLTWKLVSAANGKGMAIQVTNPTPYHVSFAHVGVKAGERSIEGEGGMVKPQSTETFPLPELGSRPVGDVQAQFTTISDYGALNTQTKPLTP
jgi:chaperone protein EcpD